MGKLKIFNNEEIKKFKETRDVWNRDGLDRSSFDMYYDKPEFSIHIRPDVDGVALSICMGVAHTSVDFIVYRIVRDSVSDILKINIENIYNHVVGLYDDTCDKISLFLSGEYTKIKVDSGINEVIGMSQDGVIHFNSDTSTLKSPFISIEALLGRTTELIK